MTGTTGARTTGAGTTGYHRLIQANERRPTIYARILRLRHVNPGGVLSFLFVEGMIALAVLLALAEQVSWWAVGVLPLTVAAMVKINDVIAGALIRSTGRANRSQTRNRPDRGGSGRYG